ncbi:MAG: helix-turn-helix domain-containing protein, partial [Bacteroidales bacterium]|nr:helix-turn-helix domain-containing protein [Bacteroidales bacterium]
DITNHKDKFRIEMAKGELNIDPETFEIELDEEKLALGILQLWINELETVVEFGDDDSVLVKTKPIDHNETIEEVSLNENYDGLWNIKQVAKYLNLSVDYIYQLTRKELIPLNKVGNRVLFRKEDIDNWLLEKKS